MYLELKYGFEKNDLSKKYWPYFITNEYYLSKNLLYLKWLQSLKSIKSNLSKVEAKIELFMIVFKQGVEIIVTYLNLL